MTVTESMKALVDSKVQKLNRIWSGKNSDNIRLRVVLNSAPEGKFLVKLDLDLDGTRYYTEEPGYELETAIVDSVEELLKQYSKNDSKYTSKWEEKRDSKGMSEKDLADMAAPEDEYDYWEEGDSEDTADESDSAFDEDPEGDFLEEDSDDDLEDNDY